MSVRNCWYALRQWRNTGVSMSDSKPVETAERLMLAMPKEGRWSIADEEGQHPLRRDLSEISIRFDAAERLQRTFLGGKAHSHGLFMRHVLSHGVAEFHSKPPRLKSATSRSPARSTLA